VVYAAQPAGYPSVIRYELVAKQSKQESAVTAGRADLVQFDENDESLAVRYPARVHFGLKLTTSMPSSTPASRRLPNIKAGKPLTTPIDRAQMLQVTRLAPGPGHRDVPGCFPADFPGHRSYCPYTAGAQDGGWHAPDMARRYDWCGTPARRTRR